MVIRNTSQYPTDKVRELVKFGAFGVNDKRVCVNVKNCNNSSYRGVAYPEIPWMSNAPRSSRYLVTLRIGKANRFPITNGERYKRVPTFKIRNWMEAIVALSAHEFRHIHQYRHDLRRSEVDCQKWEIKALDRYRREGG